MSRHNLPYIVTVKILHGKHRKSIALAPWPRIEDEINDNGAVNPTSQELHRLVPLFMKGRKVDIISAHLRRLSGVREDYISELKSEYGTANLSDIYPVNKVSIFATSINTKLDELIEPKNTARKVTFE